MTVKLYQSSFAGGELSPRLAKARFDLAKYANGAAKLRNFVVHPHGGAGNRPGTRFVGEAKFGDRRCRLAPFIFNQNQSYVLELGDGYIRFLCHGGYVATNAGAVLEITSPWRAWDLDTLKWAQSADVMTLTHRSYPIYELRRYGHNDWRLGLKQVGSLLAAPQGVTAFSAAPYTNTYTDTYTYAVAALDQYDNEGPLSATSSVTCHSLGKYSSNASGATVWSENKAGVTWSAVPGAARYRVYKQKNGVFGLVGRAEGCSFTDDNILADTSDTPKKQEKPFNGAGEWPGCSTYFEQRFAAAGSAGKPETVWFSRVGAFADFSRSSPMQSDDGFDATMAASQVNEIRHLVPINDLLAFTSSGVWKISGGDGGLAPQSIRMRPQAYTGATHLQPLVIDSHVLFVQERSGTVRAVGYSFENDAYVGNDLSILSQHLFDGRVLTEWSWQSSPLPIIWAVRDDGMLLGMTYVKEQQITAWHAHETDGSFHAVCAIPEDGIDALYVAVHRWVNGTRRLYIERMAPFEVTDVAEAFYVDSGLSLHAEKPVMQVWGLDHLEGKEVAILADGHVHPRRVVENGRIFLDREASVIHVGLAYEATLQTLEPGDASGSLAGNKKRLTGVTLRLYAARGVWVGADEDSLSEIKSRDAAVLPGQPIPLQTADVKVGIAATWRGNGSLTLRQRDPLPVSVLAVVPEIDVGKG